MGEDNKSRSYSIATVLFIVGIVAVSGIAIYSGFAKASLPILICEGVALVSLIGLLVSNIKAAAAYAESLEKKVIYAEVNKKEIAKIFDAIEDENRRRQRLSAFAAGQNLSTVSSAASETAPKQEEKKPEPQSAEAKSEAPESKPNLKEETAKAQDKKQEEKAEEQKKSDVFAPESTKVPAEKPKQGRDSRPPAAGKAAAGDTQRQGKSGRKPAPTGAGAGENDKRRPPAGERPPVRYDKNGKPIPQKKPPSGERPPVRYDKNGKPIPPKNQKKRPPHGAHGRPIPAPHAGYGMPPVPPVQYDRYGRPIPVPPVGYGMPPVPPVQYDRYGRPIPVPPVGYGMQGMSVPPVQYDRYGRPIPAPHAGYGMPPVGQPAGQPGQAPDAAASSDKQRKPHTAKKPGAKADGTAVPAVASAEAAIKAVEAAQNRYYDEDYIPVVLPSEEEEAQMAEAINPTPKYDDYEEDVPVEEERIPIAIPDYAYDRYGDYEHPHNVAAGSQSKFNSDEYNSVSGEATYVPDYQSESVPVIVHTYDDSEDEEYVRPYRYDDQPVEEDSFVFVPHFDGDDPTPAPPVKKIPKYKMLKMRRIKIFRNTRRLVHFKHKTTSLSHYIHSYSNATRR
ncbi:MAG: hypothetical protein LBL82_05840 [Oscillospiraceae bacterium]|nr:hypothetical protein [Oscillospiraceae bacterium]